MIDLNRMTGKPGVLFRNATVLTMDNHQVLQNCDVRCRDGVISQIGPTLPVGNVRVIDASGR